MTDPRLQTPYAQAVFAALRCIDPKKSKAENTKAFRDLAAKARAAKAVS